MRSVDVHQHLWPEAVLRVLERRGVPPKATWRRDRWHVELPAEPGFDVHPKDHDPAERARGLRVDRALVALSPPAGLEALPARPLGRIVIFGVDVEAGLGRQLDVPAVAAPGRLRGNATALEDAQHGLGPEVLVDVDGAHRGGC